MPLLVFRQFALVQMIPWSLVCTDCLNKHSTNDDLFFGSIDGVVYVVLCLPCSQNLEYMSYGEYLRATSMTTLKRLSWSYSVP